MKNYKTVCSFSFRDYGHMAGVWRDKCKQPICMGLSNDAHDMASYCRALAGTLLEMAHQYDHNDDFCTPEFDKQHQEIQLEKLRKTMQPIFEEKKS